MKIAVISVGDIVTGIINTTLVFPTVITEGNTKYGSILVKIKM